MKRAIIFPGYIVAAFTMSGMFFSDAVPDKQSNLQSTFEEYVRNFHGQAGIYVYCPGRKLEIVVNADSLFPTASMIKVPILCTLWDEVARGILSPDSIPGKVRMPLAGLRPAKMFL
jgi:beta-lactamase class A